LSEDYVIGVTDTLSNVDATAWDALLYTQPNASPFMRHAYLAALVDSGSACARTGWRSHCFTVHQGGILVAACMVFEKSHSYGEYVFDWAWANAYAEHGLAYYPKALVAVPFTPVPGTRLLARDQAARAALIAAVRDWCADQRLSSLHLLFGDETDLAACEGAGLMRRSQVQFHWKNGAPPRSAAAPAALPPVGALATLGRPGDGSDAPVERDYPDFDGFLATLRQDKRKKIRQERRKVTDAGVDFEWRRGADITSADWDFFYRCYERTYLEHGNPPYLTRPFFEDMARTMPEAWVLFIAERDGHPIASSLIATSAFPASATGQKDTEIIAYGRYWGALERVDCLHFEACYYQPLQWCIEHGVHRFEGGAQGEHKMARALLPVQTSSAHWLAHPAFADAVERFLEREGEGVDAYLQSLHERTPFRKTQNPA